MKRVAVVGGGVSGLGAAVRIKEAYPSFEVTIITKDVTPNTTGDGSAGLWTPYLLGSTPKDKIIQWSRDTHNLFCSLWKQGLGGSCVIPVLSFTKANEDPPSWKDIVYGFTELTQQQLDYWNDLLKKKYKRGFSYTTFTCEPKKLLPYLMERFSSAGGLIIRREEDSLDDLMQEYDIIINCTGLEARKIVQDYRVYAIRGQVARVTAPWIYFCIMEDDHYIIPNTNNVVLGGTHQEYDYNLEVSPIDSKYIRDGCEVLVPGLVQAPTEFEWVGLRPGRDAVRVERGDFIVRNKDSTMKRVIIIHNYGHGGSGVTLFWGCAGEVLSILREALQDSHTSKL